MAKTLEELRVDLMRHSLDPLYDYLEVMQAAMKGDLVLKLTPATLGSSAAAVNAAIAGAGAKFSRTITVELVTAAGERHTWFNGTFAAAEVEVTAGNGVAAIAGGGSTVTLEGGVGEITLDYTGTWATGDTETLTITGGTLLGYSVSNKTSVDTLVA